MEITPVLYTKFLDKEDKAGEKPVYVMRGRRPSALDPVFTLAAGSVMPRGDRYGVVWQGESYVSCCFANC